MNKPKNRAELVRYLAEHPNLFFIYPGGIMPGKPGDTCEERRFLRMTNNQFVLAKPNGKETWLAAKAGEMVFTEEMFTVKFPAEWTDVPADKVMQYVYRD